MASLARQAAAYPNPGLSVSHEPKWRDGQTDSETYVNLSQRIEWPGIRSARTLAADRLAAAARANFSVDSARTALRVKEAFVTAVREEEHVLVLEELVELFRKAEQDGVVQKDSGEISGYSLRRLRLERARYELQLGRAMSGVRDARRLLSQLILPESPATSLAPRLETAPPSREITLQRALELARTSRSELVSARASAEAAQADLDFVTRSRTPSPTVLGGFKRQSDGFRGLLIGLSFDLPIRNRNRGLIQANEARFAASGARIAQAQSLVEGEVRLAYASYAALWDQRDLLSDQLLVDMDSMIESAETGYVEGEMSVLELLDAADAFRDARRMLIDLEADLRMAYFNLTLAVGHDIP